MDPLPIADPIVPLRRAADEIGRHPDTLKRYGASGTIRLLRIGPKKWGVRRSELNRFLQRAEAKPGDAPNQ